jgi:DNA-binding response OmpR family regulator
MVDVMLPDGDGRDLIKSIRDLARSTKVVLTSVLTRYELRDHDADSYLAKPFRGVDVTQAITSAGLAPV